MKSKNSIKYTIRGQTGILEKEFETSREMGMFVVGLIFEDESDIISAVVDGVECDPKDPFKRIKPSKEIVDKVFKDNLKKISDDYDNGKIESMIFLIKHGEGEFSSEIFTGGKKLHPLEWIGFLSVTCRTLEKNKL